MDIYDFNKVIYDGNLLLDFYFFIFKKHFASTFGISNKLLFKFIGYIFGKYTLDEFYSFIFAYLYSLPDIDSIIQDFTNNNKKKVSNKLDLSDNDILVSNLPDYLIFPMIDNLNIRCFCSTFDTNTHTVSSYLSKEEMIAGLNNLDNEYNNYYSNTNYNEQISKICKKTYILDTNLSDYKPSLKTKLFKMFFDKSFILFLFVGVVNTLNGVIFSSLYSIAFQANLAFVFGYITSLTISYLLNSFITFKENLTFKKYIKFCISYIPNFIIQNLIVFIVYNTLHLHKLIAYLLAAIIGIPVTFVLMKIFAFSSKKEST